MFVKHSKEKQDLKVVCKSIMQQCDRVDLRAAIRSQRWWASVRVSLCPISCSRESGEAQATSFSTQPRQADTLRHETFHVVGIYSLSLSPHNEQGPQLVICLLERVPGSWQPAKQAAKLGKSGRGVERNARDLTVNVEWRQWCSYSPTFIFTWWHKKEGEENLLNETWHSLIKVWFRLQQSFCFVHVSVLPHHGQPNRRNLIK